MEATRDWGLGFRVCDVGLGFRVWGFQAAWIRDQILGIRVFRAEGLQSRDCRGLGSKSRRAGTFSSIVTPMISPITPVALWTCLVKRASK